MTTEMGNQTTDAGDGSPSAATLGSLDDVFRQMLHPLERGISDVARGLREVVELQSDLRDRVGRIEEIVNAEPVENDAHAVSANNIEQIMLGEELCRDERLTDDRGKLVEDVCSGDPSARALTGQIMLVSSASADRLAPLIKEVGEALYRWCPKTSSGEERLERGLADWLNRVSALNGLRAAIELVSPGDRFDTRRHIADGRGARITDVNGWVVLRENGDVYTKAKVRVA